MTVGIIAANNLRYSPYVFYYTKILEELDIKYEILIPDRNKGMRDVSNKNVKKFDWNKKYSSYLNYFFYSKKLKKYSIRRFDFLIVLTTNIAVFASMWLKKFFNQRYIVDIRDYTYENNRLYFYLEKQVISHAKLKIISSKKFETFLPSEEYLICHNNVWSSERHAADLKKTGSRIVIGYVGAITYKNQCIKLMNLVEKDDRFEFHFYGSGVAESELIEYAKKINSKRIKFFGEYNSKDKENIIKKIDILFNAYGFGFPLVDYALSNKLYDSLYFCKPILNCPNTYMSEMGGPLSFEINLESAENLNDLSEWFENLNPMVMEEYASSTYSSILKEDRLTKDRIKEILKKDVIVNGKI